MTRCPTPWARCERGRCTRRPSCCSPPGALLEGEGANLNGAERHAEIKPIFASGADKVGYGYCITCSGCNFGPLKPMGESLGFTTVREESHKISD